MANYKEPYEDSVEYFERALDDAGLQQTVKVKYLVNDKLKDIGKVKKASDVVKFLNGVDVIVEFNEMIFESLEDQQKQIVADELIAYIHHDTEKDKVSILKPDVVTFSGVIKKYGHEVYFRLNETIKEALSQKDDKEVESG